VIDFEKLGKLYLGREFDAERAEPNEVPVLYDSKDLTTHAVCVGMTGSGKTGLCLTLLEEAAIDGIPALCIDPKGDLGNLALTFPELRPSDFEPWIDPAEAERKGRTVTEQAEAVSSLWREGLAEWGQDGARIARFRDAVDISIYTPGSSAGRALRVLESFDPPTEGADADEQRDQIMGAVSGLLALLGIDPDPVNSKEHILLSNLLSHAWSKGESLQLGDLVRGISEPPFDRIGVMDLETFYGASERQKLAMQMNGLLASPGFSTWLDGEPLDVQRLLWTEEGKPRITILSIAHLSEAERMFFVSTLLNRVVSWVRRQSGTSSLRALPTWMKSSGFFRPFPSLHRRGRCSRCSSRLGHTGSASSSRPRIRWTSTTRPFRIAGLGFSGAFKPNATSHASSTGSRAHRRLREARSTEARSNDCWPAFAAASFCCTTRTKKVTSYFIRAGPCRICAGRSRGNKSSS